MLLYVIKGTVTAALHYIVAFQLDIHTYLALCKIKHCYLCTFQQKRTKTIVNSGPNELTVTNFFAGFFLFWNIKFLPISKPTFDTGSKSSLKPNIKLYNMCVVLAPPTDKFRFIEDNDIRYKCAICWACFSEMAASSAIKRRSWIAFTFF